MIMPFLRLVLIYIAVAAAAVVFFNRDTVLPMVGWPWFGNEAAELVPEDVAVKVAEEPETQAIVPEIAPTETANTQPIQQPVAEPETNNKTPTAPNTASENPAPAANLTALRNEARQAYWNGDIAKTETMYKAMAAAHPENVDILGELGNLYFSQRRFDDAGTYFHMAAKQLISEGNPQKAMSLINVLQSIAPAKAAELRNLAAAKP